MRSLYPYQSRRSSLTTRDLFSEFERFFNDFEKSVYGRDASQDRQSQSPETLIPMAMDLEENEKAYLVTFDIPGVKEDDIRLDVNAGRLTVSAERKRQVREGQSYVERTHGKYTRSLTLPEDINQEQIEAHYDSGVLTIALPKAAPTQARNIRVQKGSEGILDRWFGSKEAKNTKETTSTSH